jgi:uncharacterized heparinase superfamily protein
MGKIDGILRYWHTARHLRAGQVVGRVRFRLARPLPDRGPPPPLRARFGPWCAPPARRRSWLAGDVARFLNVERPLASCGWDDPSLPKLWRYNLHYFDDLLAADAGDRRAAQASLIDRWVREGRPGHGTGWEPYPTSLRIVNWIKWALAGGQPSQEAVHSLAVQARWLTRRLEWHLLGNHLFVNAKALVFAGCFFDGAEADGWRRTGTRILQQQVPEQILDDGGQFERSPMYHALVLEDVLDLENVLCAFGMGDGPLGGLVRPRIGPMRRWLQAMTHPDGEISFFNDAAIGIAPPPAEVHEYAIRLGHPALDPPSDGIVSLEPSGYVRMQLGDAVAIADVGPVGPDYLPGHAHADTLSFELSLRGERLLVNSGTSEYGVGAERLRQRGSGAHNTVTIDGQDSSEVWSGFRVARRARPFMSSSSGSADGLRVECSHDGYRRLPGSPVHRRAWKLSRGSLEVLDEVGPPAGRGCLHVHLAPGVRCSASGDMTRDGRMIARLALDGASGSWGPSTWHPEFGRVVSNESLSARIAGTACAMRLTWT